MLALVFALGFAMRSLVGLAPDSFAGPSKPTDFSEIWLSGLSFLDHEGRRSEYLTLRSELLKDPSQASRVYRSLIEVEFERKNRGDLMNLIYEIERALCTHKFAHHCQDFIELWRNGISKLFIFESSPQKLFAARQFLLAGNCREASSVLNEIERVEGRCIPLIEALIELKRCEKNSTAIEALSLEIEQLRGLIRAN